MLNQHNIKAIIFDVDETLTTSISWFEITAALGASVEQHHQIYENLKRGKLSLPVAKAQVIKLWQATGNANKKYFQELFDTWNFKNDASETIAYLKQKYRLCLISGALDMYVEIVAKKLQITDWYANSKIFWDEQGELLDLEYSLDQAQGKLLLFQKFAAQYNLDPANCIAIGDGRTDVLLFKNLGGAILIKKNDNASLEKLVDSVITDLEALKEIL